MSQFQEFVVVYFMFPKTKEIYYLKKDRPHITQLHDRYVGFGGRIDPGEAPLTAIQREIWEELNYKLDIEKLIYSGIFTNFQRSEKLHIFKISLYEKIFKEGVIENEGFGKYLSYDYHHKFPVEFPKSNLLFQDKVIFSEEFFEVELK